jgi:hypothetical protein
MAAPVAVTALRKPAARVDDSAEFREESFKRLDHMGEICHIKAVICQFVYCKPQIHLMITVSEFACPRVIQDYVSQRGAHQ